MIDPRYAPGTGVPEKDGITPALAYELVKACMNSGLVRSIDLVELNVLLDKSLKTKELFENILKVILS